MALAWTPPGAAPEPPPIALLSWAPKPPLPGIASSVTSLRRYGVPSAVLVVSALARFSAVTFIRRRCAVSALAEISMPPNIDITKPPPGCPKSKGWCREGGCRAPTSPDTHGRTQDRVAGLGDGHGGLLLERVGGHLGRLVLDVDRVAVGLRRADGLIGLRREARGAEGALGVRGAHRRGQRTVEVHVDALVAGRARVGDVRSERLLTLCGAGDAALERQLGGIDQHGTEWLLKEGKGRPVREPDCVPSLGRTLPIGPGPGDL